MIKDYLSSNNLIICPNSLKNVIIKEINSLNTLIPYKIMDLNEFCSNYFFTYNINTINYVMCKLNVNSSIALDYLNSFIYVKDKEYSNYKLNQIVNLKKEIIDNNLLIYNYNFNYYLERVKIIIYGYDLDPFYINIFNKYNSIIISTNNDKVDRIVYEFFTINEEVSYIISDIKDKLDNGVSISDIKIISSSEYNNVLKRLFNLAHIPIDLVNKVSLYNLSIRKDIINYLKKDKSFDEILELVSDSISSDIYDKLLSIFNKYVEYSIDKNNLIDLISYDLKNTNIVDKHKSSSVRIITFDDIDSNDYVYVLGFNKENYPKIFKDEEFLSDNMKEELGLFTSNKKNEFAFKNLRNNLYKNTNYIITYKLKDSFNSYNPCILIEEDNMTVIKNPSIKYNFSNNFNRISLALEYDNFYKYGIISDNLKLLSGNYKDINYNSYNNKFTGIDNNKFLNNLDKLSLSYSSIDNFFRCSFRYYLNNILKIEEDITDTFYIEIGNIFHYVLSKYREEDFDFDKYWNEEASKYSFTLDKVIFLDKLKQELKFDIEIIKKQENYTKMNDFLFEERFFVDIPNDKNKNVYFTGVIDKIIYDDINNKKYVGVVDYKTGTLPSNLNNIIYGIGMQLPIYLYLIKRSDLFKDSEIVGFYLQKIINRDMKRTANKTLEQLKENALKLVGYSNIDPDIISNFDYTFNDSGLINGLKQKTDGSFYSYSKVLSDEEIEKMDNLVDNKIKEGASKILDSKFDIDPKKVDKDYIGCEFCCYRDICFKRENDYVELEKYNNLEFLRGEEDA